MDSVAPTHEAQLLTRRAWWLDAAGALSGMAFAWLAWRSHQHGALPLTEFFAVLACGWAALLLAWRTALGLPQEWIARRLWRWAIALRLVAFFAQPVLEDDYWRYLWDGRQFAVTGNPYGSAPIDHFGDASVSEDFRSVLDNINHPEVRTPYGPGCELGFLLSYWTTPGKLWPWKLLLLTVDLLTLRLLRGAVGARYSLLYAWCPLLVLETGFNAHPDSLAIGMAVAALVCFKKQRWLWMAACLGLAASTRVTAVLLLLPLLWRAPKAAWLLCAGIIGALHAPFLAQGSWPGWGGTAAFAQHWEFNSFLFALAQWVSNAEVAKMACLAGFALCYVGILQRWKHRPASTWPRGDWIFGSFFAFSAVVNPWYLLWLLPFVAARPGATGLAAMAAVTLSYAHGLFLPDFGLAPYAHPAWVRPAEAMLVLLGAAWDARWVPWPPRSAGK